MFNIKETDDAKCFEKAQRRGQLTWTLVQQDKTAPIAICEWIKLNIETAPADKLRKALESAIAYRDYPQRKMPD